MYAVNHNGTTKVKRNFGSVVEEENKKKVSEKKKVFQRNFLTVKQRSQKIKKDPIDTGLLLRFLCQTIL